MVKIKSILRVVMSGMMVRMIRDLKIMMMVKMWRIQKVIKNN